MASKWLQTILTCRRKIRFTISPGILDGCFLRQKQKLATSYRDLVKKLDDDVHKMIKQGVATKADGLKVDVKVNEADMQIMQVEDGLTLSKSCSVSSAVFR